LLDAQCSGAGSPWNYENEGPDAWPHSFQKCKGLKQSPIDIVKANTEHDKNLKPFLLQNYDSILSWNITHNGHGGKKEAIS
jgi:carbonic anhydrase